MKHEDCIFCRGKQKPLMTCGNWWLETNGCCGKRFAHLGCYIDKFSEQLILGYFCISGTDMLSAKKLIKYMDKKQKEKIGKRLKKILTELGLK